MTGFRAQIGYAEEEPIVVAVDQEKPDVVRLLTGLGVCDWDARTAHTVASALLSAVAFVQGRRAE